MKIGKREFDTAHHTYVMGILNVTPDSFSDGGKYRQLDAALFHAEQMVSEGVDIIDVGGESTRPGFQKVSEEEEIARVVPVIEKLKGTVPVPLSVDTYKAAVAKAAVAAGADLINDIWGLRQDVKMAEVIAKSGAACCLMHNRKIPEDVPKTLQNVRSGRKEEWELLGYSNLLPDILSDLEESLRLAKQAGIPQDNIILDPGIGFGKTYQMNLEVLKHLEKFQKFGLPVLLGTSRKSVIGLTLDLPVDQREEGTLVTTVLAVQSRCAFVRVHDVLKNKRAIQMAEAIRDA
ncbi:MAG: dihydropteroate synthase [Hespellia sp.]|jgi:dihydropteroate synthase|nr:dihydropteroate synthase [Hespellia sp.]